MKFIIAMVVATLSATAWAQPNFPPYFAPVKGKLVENFEGLKQFSFNPGTLEDCTKKPVTADFITYDCKVTGAAMELTGENREPLRLDLPKIIVWQKRYRGQWYDEYRFEGAYSQPNGDVPVGSRMFVILWRYQTTPNDFLGTWTVPDYGVTRTIIAKALEF